jgi:hypothetical protein
MAMAATFTTSVTAIASTITTAATASTFTAKHIQCALDFIVCCWT